MYQAVVGSIWAPLHGSIRPLKGCYYTQERQSQERQDFRGRFDFAFQSALERAWAALSTRLLLQGAHVRSFAWSLRHYLRRKKNIQTQRNFGLFRGFPRGNFFPKITLEGNFRAEMKKFLCVYFLCVFFSLLIGPIY